MFKIKAPLAYNAQKQPPFFGGWGQCDNLWRLVMFCHPRFSDHSHFTPEVSCISTLSVLLCDRRSMCIQVVSFRAFIFCILTMAPIVSLSISDVVKKIVLFWKVNVVCLEFLVIGLFWERFGESSRYFCTELFRDRYLFFDFLREVGLN